jgi:hypothetical protein
MNSINNHLNNNQNNINNDKIIKTNTKRSIT